MRCVTIFGRGKAKALKPQQEGREGVLLETTKGSRRGSPWAENMDLPFWKLDLDLELKGKLYPQISVCIWVEGHWEN